MSVKFEKEQIRTTTGAVGKDQDTIHKIGEVLTGGKQQNGYLAVCGPDPTPPQLATETNRVI
jgi:hypothetical protein